MKRVEVDCATGASIEIDQIAYKDALGNVMILDLDEDATGLTVLSEIELEAYRNLAPTKEQRIANVLATTGKGKDRTLIQQVISFAEMVAAPMLATQYSVTLELAIMGLYARNKTYRECKDAETAIEAIEDEP